MREHLIIYLLLLFISSMVSASNELQNDNRIDLKFTELEKNIFLSDMRHMLGSIQGIITGIGTENRDLIVRSARYSGNQMSRNTPQSIKEKLPQAFKEIGGPTHLMFEELVIRAETDDMATLAEFTGQLMNQCHSCHTKFKIK